LATLTGALPDGTRITRKAPISRQGHWPVYAPLYQLQGAAVGWLRFETNAPADDFNGSVDWFRPTLPTALYPNGFTNQTFFTGARYLPPLSATNRVLPVVNANIVLSGGGLTQTWTNPITLGPGPRVTNSGPNTLSMVLVPGTGLFKGTFLDPQLGRTVTFNGSLRQKSTNGSGFFLGTNSSGRVSLEPLP
jgi:hypothetical protein